MGNVDRVRDLDGNDFPTHNVGGNSRVKMGSSPYSPSRGRRGSKEPGRLLDPPSLSKSRSRVIVVDNNAADKLNRAPPGGQTCPALGGEYLDFEISTDL